MSTDPRDSAPAIGPTPSNCIDGFGTNKRQRSGSEEEEHQRASANDGNDKGRQQPQGQGSEPVLPEDEAPDKARQARAALRPDQPSPDERAAHDFTHCPYLSWSRARGLGRGRNRYHHRIDGRGDIVQRIALDDMFFNAFAVARTFEEAQ